MVRILSLAVCHAVVVPVFGGWGRKAPPAPRIEQSPRPSPSPSPSPVTADGKRQLTAGPYVPAALRTNNQRIRGLGMEGKVVDPLPVKRGAPLMNLPDLSASRGIRQSPVTKPSSISGVNKTESATLRQVEMACGDCDPGGGGGGASFPDDPYFGTARTEPANDTGAPGVTLGSQNFNWSMPLVSLPGRAGLDLSIALYYNSLVWTKQGTAIQYNADHGTPAPGFQLGLPRLQDRFFDTDENSWAYMMVTPSGGRVELKQIGTTNVYESADSTYTQLTFSGTTPIVRTTDGTQFVFGTHVSPEWRCTKVEDRNGNYVSATYNGSNGHLLTITDTLGRVLTFNYNGDGNLESITQPWGSSTHYWVWFEYAEMPMAFSFSGITSVYGATYGVNQTLLDHIAFADNTSYHFDYNGYGQVYQIRHKAPDGHELEHAFYNIDNPGTQTDCPRFTERHDWAEDWNNNQDAITYYAVTTGANWTDPETGNTQTGTRVQQTAPDLTVYKEYSHATGWDTGLTRLAEFYDAGGINMKKWISTVWTQDNETLTFPQNPRIAEVHVRDDALNHKKTVIEYDQGYSLPTTISEYGGPNVALQRQTVISYVSDSAYLDQRLVGLPFQKLIKDGSGNIAAKEEYQYDDAAPFFVNQQPATNFDATYYGWSFRIGRGNLTAVLRYDCTNSTTADNVNLAIYTQRNAYNLAGLMVSTKDALDHTTSIDYTDNFFDSNDNQGTLAYATTVTDADGYSSVAEYKYEYGAITRAHLPTSGTNAGQNVTYLDITRDYDDFGRLKEIKNQGNNAYTRLVYDLDGKYVHTYQTIKGTTQADEFHSWQILDGGGRVRATAADHNTNTFSGQYVIYDNMGRVIEQSNPTEIVSSNGSWTPAGDDAAVGWHAVQQTYDWKGRPLQTTNPDSTTRVLSYGGCGCAGGEVTTATDEKGRQRLYTKDSLGRLVQVQELDPAHGAVYSTTTYIYNPRDQILEIHQRDAATNADEARTFDYDGHGRLLHRITPEQGTTTYSYYDDDTTHVVTDARLVTTSYEYNNRRQIKKLSYDVTHDPTQQAQATAEVIMAYDAAGHRISMSDGLGSASYNFNSLGQMYSESRTFTSVGTYTLNYEYNPGGELKRLTNSWGSSEVTYGYDNAGRLNNIGGSGYAGVTSYASAVSYRAFGAIKSMTYGDGVNGQGHTLATAYDSNLRATKWDVTNVLGYQYQYDGYYHERTGRVVFAENVSSGLGATGGADSSLDRSYEYDIVGRLLVSHSGAEARAHVLNGQWGTKDGPYSLGFNYDVWGNLTERYGWGGEVQGPQDGSISYTYSNGKNQRDSFSYDAAGNVINDTTQTYLYDATGQQTSATWSAGTYTPSFTNDPLNPNGTHTDILLVHLTELRAEVNKLRLRAGLAAVTNWNPDPNPQANVTPVHHNHITQLRAKLEEALNALHLPIGTYAHAGPNANDPIYAIDFQELRDKIKGAWAALTTAPSILQSYDGDGLRVMKNDYGAAIYYLRSSVLGGQVVAELNYSQQQQGWQWWRGYVYSGSSLLAVQQSGVFWTYEDPVTKSKRVTDANGNVVSMTELDPWGADTNRSFSEAFQPRRYTTYDRDGNGSDEAMFRRYNRKNARFDQPDPYEGSYDFGNPQSFNRYAYTQNDPANFVDPTGTMCQLIGWENNDFGRFYSWLCTRDSDGGDLSGKMGGGGRGGGHEPPPQNPLRKATGGVDASAKCATPNNLVNYLKKNFESLWDKTSKSGEENGELVFWERSTNTYPEVQLSEGRHVRQGPTEYAPNLPMMPEVGPETTKAFDTFAAAGRSVNFIAFFHTHPNLVSGASQNGDPSWDDTQYQSIHGNVLGIIRTGNGYSFYLNGRKFGADDPKADECIAGSDH
jgi:RHS repeat-associated protein